MRAYRILEDGTHGHVDDVPVPDPGPGEILVRVAGAGLCHSDIHLFHLGAGLPWKPFTLGHETSGWVASTGPGVDGLDEGDAVIVHGTWGCGTCPPCRHGHEALCARNGGVVGGGLGRDGGLAEYVLVPAARHLVPLGDLDPVTAAPLDDAAVTPYHAIRARLARLLPDETAVVIGVGGLGHLAVQILRAVTAVRIVAVDVAPERRALAEALGADVTLDPAADGPDAVKDVSGGGAVLALDLVGSEQTLAFATGSLRPGGEVVLVGLAGGSVPFGFYRVPFESSLSTTFWGSVADLREVVALAAAGRISVDAEVVPMDGAGDAYRRLEAGELSGSRAVVAPGA